MGRAGDHPGDRVGQVQHEQAVGRGEHRVDPDHPQPAGASQGDQGGGDGGAHPADHPAGDVHQAAQQVGQADDVDAVQPVGDDGLVGGVDGQQLLAEQDGQPAQRRADDRHDEQAVPQDEGDALLFAGAHVLAGKVEGGLVDGVHGGVDEVFDVGRGGAARHRQGAEGVDGGLDQHVGDGEHHALDAGRQAHPDDLQQDGGADLQLPEAELVAGVRLHQAAHHQEGGQVLGQGGGQGHARHIQVEGHHKKDVQAGVGDAGGGQEKEGPLGVPDGPQDARAKVVDHHGGHAQKDDPHIEHRLVQQVGRGVHPAQQGGQQGDARQDQHRAAAHRQQQGGVDGVVDPLPVLGAVAAGHDHAAPDGQAQKQVDHQAVQRGGGPHRRHGAAAGELPQHDDVGRVEQQLQDAGGHQRDRKAQQAARQGAAAHIYLRGMPHSCRSFLFRQGCARDASAYQCTAALVKMQISF